MSIHRAESGPDAPHFAPKLEIPERIEGSKIPFTTVSQDNLLQVDLDFRFPAQDSDR